MCMLRIFLSVVLIFCLKNSVLANEQDYFLMLKYNKVNVRYGPSSDDKIKYIYKMKYLPLKIIDKKDNFRKVIDHKNNSGWIHISQLKSINSLIVLEDKIIFKKNTFYSKPLARIEKGKLLLIKKCKLKWCKVKANQLTGWLNTKNVWGIN